ncbi:hypothetical protein DL89DRAFT_269004 [Linderina pennispora]|uniref:Tr-type G domain-containing protein n=1 Tax=Linderina pennispora TaxID=61395 RepID=A0A1Y1W2U6_9FUNG|nr:uncharacterized protein DL89DRAFT_269004 [Linderina pennispora]ORX67808.1 hypothetical protein DL89DRAFT_269004 [Linderina pennispora]
MYSEDVVRVRSLSVLDEGVHKLPPETDRSGNVEYKTKLEKISHTPDHTSGEPSFHGGKLAEGNGHAIYIVGVHDDGEVIGITPEEFDITLGIIQKMAEQLDNARITTVNRRVLANSRVVAEVHVTQRISMRRSELRNSSARSVTFGSIGFDADGVLLNYTNNRSAEQIFQRAQHVVTFIDTCGYAKHLKTTASAVTGYSSHVFCIAVPADATEISAATREYLAIAAVLGMPIIVVMTKMDAAVKASFGRLMHKLLEALETAVPGRSQCVVMNMSTDAYESLAHDIMDISLTNVLSVLRAPALDSADDGFEFHIEHWMSLDTVGTVVTGWVKAGSFELLDKDRVLMLGPDSSGNFANVKPAEPLAMRKGMLIIDAGDGVASARRRVTNEFVARVVVLSPEFRASNLQTVVVHVRSTYHQAHVVEIVDDDAADGFEWVRIRLRFDDAVVDTVYPDMPIIARGGQDLLFVGRAIAPM